jgi:hypothetical protein
VLEIAKVWAISLLKPEDDNTDQEISNDESQDPAESTLSSDIEQDVMGIWQEILHLELAHREKTIQSTMVPLPTTRSRANTIIACTTHSNL